MYTIIVRYWSDHTGPSNVNQRSSYHDAMKLWRKQCRTHRNADVILRAPNGQTMKTKEDSWPYEYGSNEPV